MADPLASIIISTYAASRLTYAFEAIASVQRQTYRNHEVVFVVDEDAALAQEAAGRLSPGVRLIVNPRPGMANARNCGLEHARGDIIVFLDDDAVAEPDWLSRLMIRYEDEQVVGVGGRSVPAWDGDVPEWFPEELYWILGCTYRGYRPNGGDVRNMLGNSMSYRTSTLNAIGGFRLGRQRYWQVTSGTAEETEVCLRIRRKFPHARIIYEPEAVVHHFVPKSRLRLGYLWRRALGEGVAKARIRRLHDSDRDPLSHEAEYLHHLFFTFMPRALSGKGAPITALKQISAASLVIGAVGIGYGWTYLKESLSQRHEGV